MDGIRLEGKPLSSDPAMRRVIDARARELEAKRELEALRRDRDDLLGEYTDMRRARPVPKARPPRAKGLKEEWVRVCVGDVHGMRQDPAAVGAFLADLKVLDPDEVILGGDVLECGGWLAKHLTLGYVAETDYSYQEDCRAGNAFLDAVMRAAGQAVMSYLAGNHEDRIEKWCVDQTRAHGRDAEFLRRAFEPATMLRLEERGVKYYRRDVVHEHGLPPGWVKRGKMWFVHELGSGKNAAREAVLKTAGNVTYFHTHREDTATVVLPGVGIVKAFCPGCLCVRQPMWRHSDPTSWSHGYGIDIVARSGIFQRIHVPIWNGQSLAGAMVRRFKG